MDKSLLADVIILFLADKRTSNWALMSSPWPVLCLVMFYILAVVLGPRLMKTRDAFNIKRILIIYNLFLVILSVYMMYEVGIAGIRCSW